MKPDKTDPANLGARATLLPTARDQSLVGVPATIQKIVKTRGEYLLKFDDGRSYYAFARNIALLDPAA